MIPINTKNKFANFRIVWAGLKFFLLSIVLTDFSVAQTPKLPKQAPVPVNAWDINPLLPGEQVPDITVRTGIGEEKNLRQLIGEKPAVILFYRGGWCPFCNRQLSELRKVTDKISDLGYQIIAISPDAPPGPNQVKTATVGYTSYSDDLAIASRAFGLAYAVQDNTFKALQEKGMDIEKASGQTHRILPVPAVYIASPDGTILFSYVNPDYKIRLKPDLLLAAAKAFAE